MPKLTKSDVIIIKQLLRDKDVHIQAANELIKKAEKHKKKAKELTRQKIGEKFGVTKAAIQLIAENVNWQNV